MILHFDFSTGASGDKILGSLIELGEALGPTSFDEVRQLAEALVPGVRVERTRIESGGVQATGIEVVEEGAQVKHWRQIRTQIEEAGASGLLSTRATATSLEAFGAIARAEAAVHGCEIEQVHFHEVGAADSIIDICCSSFILDKLGVEAVFATPLALGFGTFVCSHGELPVPAPATAALIEGLPVYASSHEGELTTPTGATLARTFVDAWEPLPCIRPLALGYGGGTRTIPGAANVVRALAGERVSLAGLETASENDWIAGQARNDRTRVNSCRCGLEPQSRGGAAGSLRELHDDSQVNASQNSPFTQSDASCQLFTEGCTLLETNIDHLSPEALAFSCEELLARGALDVWQESIAMKKGRLAVRLCVLSSVKDAQTLAASVIELTGSLGVRSSYTERTCAVREIVREDTARGAVAFKTALVASPGGIVKLRRPEYEDVARIAREQKLDFNALYGELQGSTD